VQVPVEKVVEKVKTVVVQGPEVIKTVEVIKEVPVYYEREGPTVTKDVVVTVHGPQCVREIEVSWQRPQTPVYPCSSPFRIPSVRKIEVLQQRRLTLSISLSQPMCEVEVPPQP
jgi:hypothetical protein